MEENYYAGSNLSSALNSSNSNQIKTRADQITNNRDSNLSSLSFHQPKYGQDKINFAFDCPPKVNQPKSPFKDKQINKNIFNYLDNSQNFKINSQNSKFQNINSQLQNLNSQLNAQNVNININNFTLNNIVDPKKQGNYDNMMSSNASFVHQQQQQPQTADNFYNRNSYDYNFNQNNNYNNSQNNIYNNSQNNNYQSQINYNNNQNNNYQQNNNPNNYNQTYNQNSYQYKPQLDNRHSIQPSPQAMFHKKKASSNNYNFLSSEVQKIIERQNPNFVSKDVREIMEEYKNGKNAFTKYEETCNYIREQSRNQHSRVSRFEGFEGERKNNMTHHLNTGQINNVNQQQINTHRVSTQKDLDQTTENGKYSDYKSFELEQKSFDKKYNNFNYSSGNLYPTQPTQAPNQFSQTYTQSSPVQNKIQDRHQQYQSLYYKMDKNYTVDPASNAIKYDNSNNPTQAYQYHQNNNNNNNNNSCSIFPSNNSIQPTTNFSSFETKPNNMKLNSTYQVQNIQNSTYSNLNQTGQLTQDQSTKLDKISQQIKDSQNQNQIYKPFVVKLPEKKKVFQPFNYDLFKKALEFKLKITKQKIILPQFYDKKKSSKDDSQEFNFTKIRSISLPYTLDHQIQDKFEEFYSNYQISNHKYSLDDFEVQKQLGVGKFATVYEAFNKITRKQIAIKKINKQNMIECEAGADIQNEILIQKQLSHKNIVKLYANFQDEENIYLIQSLCENRDLFYALHLQNNNKYTENEARDIIKQIIEACMYLHKKNIVHRDIKPENILIHHGIVKLTDFGCCCKIKKNKHRNTICGTLEYLSPEMATNQNYTFSVDVWAIGVLTYELTTGVSPFTGKDESQIYKDIENAQYKMDSSLSRELKDFIRQFLKKDPKDRITLKEALRHKWLMPRWKV